MFRLNRVNSAERLMRALFHPNPLLTSPLVMYSGSAGAGGRRKELPRELLRSVVRLTCESSAKGGTCDVYLVGAVNYVPKTFEKLSHTGKNGYQYMRSLVTEETYETYKEVSREREKACKEVRAVISSLKPEVVFLGLCQSLSHDLKPDQMLRRILGSLFDQEVMTEYRVAYEEAQKYGGNVILGERPREITWSRSDPTSLILRSLHFLTPNKLMNLTDFGIINGCDKRFGYDLSKEKKIFVDEKRNQYMSATLLEVARQHKSVVAVVGKWHLPEIRKYWKQPIEIEELLSVT